MTETQGLRRIHKLFEEKLVLHHSAKDKADGLRPYFVDVMDALCCHQGFRVADDDGACRAYMTKYVSKFSDAAQEEWLNDKAGADAISFVIACQAVDDFTCS